MSEACLQTWQTTMVRDLLIPGIAAVTNVKSAWSIDKQPAYAKDATNWDEKSYINAIAPNLTAAGFPARFIVDTSTYSDCTTEDSALSPSVI